MIAKANHTCILEQQGEYFQKSSISSDPLAHSRVIVIGLPSNTFFVKTHLFEIIFDQCHQLNENLFILPIIHFF